nr:MAG TPA: hypothetical protein [Caudoviricetes sp.]
MNDKEYTYDIDKYTIGVDTNGEDGIGMTVAKIENGEIYFLGNCYGENARCIDLLIKENKELKKQLEENKDNYNCLLKQKEQFEYIMSKQVDYQGQKKEFIKYLEDEINSIEPKGTGINYNCEYDSEEDYVMAMQEQSRLNTLKEILQKYKEIIGVSDENSKN